MPQLAGLPLYFENPIGRFYEHPDGYVIIDYNAGPRNLETFQSFLHHLENLLKRRGWNKMLGDHRRMDPFTEQEHDFINNQWLQVSHALQQEMQAAVLVTQEVFTGLPAALQQQDAREGVLLYHIFTEVDAATAWLGQQA
ncbi:hypothetical protein [Hymenobacter metallilatus]|uniref:STAS/SEC14 domain-containing protein n=1 Tax=Hymenobacter metallilatus TaxID=2493666 RepID=A0A428JK75_9BACT|nr:hypothetical protein [Hymenobacter metallilatus]RSK33188.1 hypothetical protein EI290_10765 [Hymenobacter metallilatus]